MEMEINLNNVKQHEFWILDTLPSTHSKQHKVLEMLDILYYIFSKSINSSMLFYNEFRYKLASKYTSFVCVQTNTATQNTPLLFCQ